MPGPVATIGSMHVCPMCDGPKPHVGGPIVGPGATNILINGKPAALMGDMCTCVGPLDMIAQGAANVFFNGVPVACQNDLTAHGGMITQGEPNVIIGSAQPTPPVTMAKDKIPFPKITFMSRVLNSDKIKEAEAIQEKLKKEEEGEPRIYNLQWLKEETVIRESKVLKKATLRAYVQNIGDGTSITFNIKRPIDSEDEDGNKTTEEKDIITLTGTVKDKMVDVEWKFEDASKEDENNNS